MSDPNITSIRIQDFALWDRMTQHGAPLSFELEITARCMNNCRHCYVNLPAARAEVKSKELTREEIERIAGEAASMGAFWCLVTGGEPLLREDFPETYLALKRTGLMISVFTTAQLITEEHVRLFAKYPPRDLEITVYGSTRKTYESITRLPGSFMAFRRGLNRLLGGGVKVRLKAMALRSNYQELPEIARFCRKRTKDHFRFDPMLHLRSDGNPKRNEEIRSERLSSAEIVALEDSDAERSRALQQGCDELIVPDLSHDACNHLFHCGAGRGSFYVSYDGYFRLCSSLCHPECTYDLRKGSLADAWRNFVPRVRDMGSDRKEFLKSCRICPIVNLCSWCPAHAHLETGELDGAVPYFCEVAHARAAAIRRSAKQDACPRGVAL